MAIRALAPAAAIRAAIRLSFADACANLAHNLSALTSCGASPLPAVAGNRHGWLERLVLNSVFRGKLTEPGKVYRFVLCVAGSLDDYDDARSVR
jgi:hypothetical protein